MPGRSSGARLRPVGRRVTIGGMATSDTSITVTRLIDAPAGEIFDVLTLPARHHEIDGSGMVVSDDRTDRVTAVGQVFRMNMHFDRAGGDYQTDNHVVGYDKNALLAWKTARADAEPLGWEWVWQLAPQGPDATGVSLTYDWSAVPDKDAQRIGFPAVTEEQLEGSLARLAAAVSS